jgi:hypothetical protein
MIYRFNFLGVDGIGGLWGLGGNAKDSSCS